MVNESDLDNMATKHAFMEERSTMTALTSITQDWFNTTIFRDSPLQL